MRTITNILTNLPAARYAFSAKERDAETGLSYFGSRYYSSDLSIWLSVDPMSDKYPSLSPYVYCANNPVKCVDPNGEDIVITDKNNNQYTYSPGTSAPECQDWKVKEAWNHLNEVYGTKAGKYVIDEMSKEGSPTFIISDKPHPKYGPGSGRMEKDNNGGGTLYLDGHMAQSEYVAHELFHGYQEMKGQGGISIHNEVEAYLFAFFTTNSDSKLTPYGICSDKYKNSYMNLVSDRNTNNFDEDFKNLVTGFCSYSVANQYGLYNGSEIRCHNQKADLLKQILLK